MRVLVVEDDNRVSQQITGILKGAGYVVENAAEGEDAQFLGDTEDYDAVVLDLGLPGIDGLTVLQRWRDMGRTMPVLILTARDSWRDKVAGLRSGADDYLAKPFEPKELLLRINSILRRVPPSEPADAAPKVLSLGAFRYDVEKGTMWHGDEPVRLTATESQLMRIFSACPGEAVSRAQLVEDLGRDKGQSQERAVDVQITRLRRKLEADPKQPRYLQTVRGAGYMLAPD